LTTDIRRRSGFSRISYSVVKEPASPCSSVGLANPYDTWWR